MGGRRLPRLGDIGHLRGRLEKVLIGIVLILVIKMVQGISTEINPIW